jgi:hypothetical protein
MYNTKNKTKNTTNFKPVYKTYAQRSTRAWNKP